MEGVKTRLGREKPGARRTRKHAFDSERDSESGHQCLVSGGIEDGAEHGVHVESPCQESIDLYNSCHYDCHCRYFFVSFSVFDAVVVTTDERNDQNTSLTRSERPA